MDLYFISVRSKEVGYLVPFLTDSEHVVSAYNKLASAFEGGAIFVYTAKFNDSFDTFVIDKEINIDDLKCS